MADGAAVDGVVALVDGPPAGVAAEAGGVEGPPRLLGPHHVAADGLAALGTSLQKFLRVRHKKLGSLKIEFGLCQVCLFTISNEFQFSSRDCT